MGDSKKVKYNAIVTMAYDLKKEEDVKEYIENLGIEYRFGCYKEKKPQVCHLLGDYLEAVKKDFNKAKKVYRTNCMDENFGKSCLKVGNYTLMGKGGGSTNAAEALTYFEKGCDLGEPTACLHAGMLLTGTGPDINVTRDVPKGYNYLKKSCENNVEMACHYLSGMYISGVQRNLKDPKSDYLIKPDMKQAFKFATKACELGNMFACANVSIMYSKGSGVEKNENEAKKFFKLAQDLKNAHETSKEIKFQQGLENK